MKLIEQSAAISAAPTEPDEDDPFPAIDEDGPLARKSEIIRSLKRSFLESGSVLFTHYRGLDTGTISALRAAIRNDAQYTVVKNTLARIAAREAGLPDIHLHGPTAVAFVHGDATSVAKKLREFSASSELEIVGGLIDGVEFDALGIGLLAELPPRRVQLATIAGAFERVIASPATLVATAVAQPARLVRALEEARRVRLPE